MKDYSLPDRSKSVKHFRWLSWLIPLMVLGAILFALKLSGTLNSLDLDQQTEFRNYEAYFKKHSCSRRLETGAGHALRLKPYLYCNNGVWAEEDLVNVANGRVPKSRN